MQTATEERVTLYYREGSSDKVYQAAIEPKGTGFIVTFAYGRRGGTINTGAKTTRPVDYAIAKKLYDKLVSEKTAKGYTPGEGGTPYQNTEKQDRVTGVLPQLLDPIDEADLPRLIADEDFWAQEKFDGRRVLIRKDDGKITGINRKGLVIDLPATIVAAVQSLGTRRCLLDGEAVGDAYFAFDLLSEAQLDLTPKPYRDRYLHLVDLMETAPSDSIRYVESGVGKGHKENLLERLKREHREGIVFKDKNAPYTAGGPASGGAQFKFKFTITASCIVAGANGSKRSVKLELLDGRKRVGVGNVTIPANQTIPAAGQIAEVRYLYAFPGGSLFQPVYLGQHDDIAAVACNVAQLKFKPADTDEN